MEEDRGILKRMKGGIKQRWQKIASNRSESGPTERAGGVTTTTLQAPSDTQSHGTPFESPPPPDATVVHGLTGNPDRGSTTHGQSEADQNPSSQENQVAPESGEWDPWKRAADGLDRKDREKLDRRIKPEREGQTAGPPPHGQAETSSHRVSASANDIGSILRTAKKLARDNENESWVPVSPTHLELP